MEIAENVLKAIERAKIYAAEKHLGFITPEIFLLALLECTEFYGAFRACDGNPKLLRKDLEDYIERYMEVSESETIDISFSFHQMLEYMESNAISSSAKEIKISHAINAMWNLQDCYAVYFMEKQEITKGELIEELIFTEDIEDYELFEDPGDMNDEFSEDFIVFGDGDSEDANDDFTGKFTVFGDDDFQDEEDAPANWKSFAPCLNDTLKDVNPLIGRAAELERTIQILCRKDKNNPLHIGEPGVGKTAITYGLVQLIRDGKVPEQLKGAKVFSLDLGGLLEGTKYRGDFEKRLKKALTHIGKETNPIIYIDEIHNLAGAGAVGEGSLDASNMLKPYLAAGKIRFIGATTYEEYKKYFEKNKSLIRRFQNVEIAEPTLEETEKILLGLKERYENFHGVTYPEEVIRYAVQMSAKHINERFLPDKAIDLIDEAGAYLKLHPEIQGEGAEEQNQESDEGKVKLVVTRDIINDVLTKICRVPIETVETEDTAGLATLEGRLKARVFGQDEAIAQVVNAVKFSKAGLLEENKPLASLLFVGPTGVGKTEIAKSLAEELGVKLIRFDMSEYGEKHAVAKLIGAPAGYVGYDEGGLLTEAVRKNPSAVVLLDEIEKAHEDIYNVLLQVMDYATLTDNQGRKADFRNVVVIMTSNAGASLLGKSGIGFGSPSQDSGVIMDTVKRTFQPEFRNRLNKIVLFRCMDDQMAAMVVDKKLKEVGEQLLKKNIQFTVDEEAKALVKKKGISPEFGAREVDRVIRNEVKTLFVDEMLFGSLTKGGKLHLTAQDGNFHTEATGTGDGSVSQ